MSDYFRKPSFTTPRQIMVDFSSGPACGLVRRRRRDISRDNRLAHRRSSYDSESDSRSRPSSSESASRTKKQQAPAEAGLIPSLFTFIETHPNLPHILSYYAQFVLNLFIVFFCIYITYSFWSTIRSDVDAKSEAVVAETLAEMAVCTQNYVENRCDRAFRVPAMETVCESWERCMNKDAYSVGRARVSAHTFAEIFNSFLEPISYKAMVNDIPVHRMYFSPLLVGY